jgi:hypothetical protein
MQNAIQSLPWAINVKFPLENFTELGEIDIRISDSIALRTNFNTVPSDGEEKNALLNLSRKRKHAWLCIDVRGFGAGDPDSGALSIAITQAKQCLYFFRKFSVLHSRETDRPLPDALAELPDGVQTVRLPHTLAGRFGRLKPVDDLLKIYDTDGAKNLLQGRWRAASNAEERARAIEESLGIAREFFQRRDHDDFGAIGAAIEWYVDSITADNQTFSYIAACIGLEALLGYGDATERMDAMSSRLSDRYGFLLGRGRADRERLAKDYNEMLKLRGKLVHARSKRLSSDEQAKLRQVQEMLSNVIDKEMSVFVQG